jgi:PAS domain S-box-containing protein
MNGPPPEPASAKKSARAGLPDLARLAEAARRADAADWPAPLEGLSWQEAIEELNVAHEELRQQNEELVAATAALEAERRRYHELYDFAPDCYLVTDPHGVIHEANLAAAGLLRHPPTRMVRRPLRLYVHPDRRAELDLLVNRLRAGEPVRGFQTLVQTREGLSVPVAIYAGPERDTRGNVVGLRWLLHDLTALKDAQHRAVQAERLAAVGQTVAALAHESRNALQRTHACLRLLALEVSGRPKALDYIGRVQKAQEDLARLFEDVRTFTAPPVLDRRPCDLRQVWRQAWQELNPDRPECGLVEDVRADDLKCNADAFRLGQVFRNLFDNALAVAPDPARVTVRAEADGPAVRLTVEDNGPGLTDEQLTKLFDPFYTTKPGGMGLGMAIARRVVEAHGGRITAGAGAAGGAAFVLTLPRGGRGGGSDMTPVEERP